MNEPIEQKKIGDNSPQANATVNDRTGLYVSIVALTLAALALGAMHSNDVNMKDIQNDATRAENHARNNDTEIVALKLRLDALEKANANKSK